MDFSSVNSANIYSNLGGRGSSTAQADKCFTAGQATCQGDASNTADRGCCINYPLIGTLEGETVATVDLIIEVVGGTYKCNTCSKNGVVDSGEYGQINMKGNSAFEPELLFSFVDQSTHQLLDPPPAVRHPPSPSVPRSRDDKARPTVSSPLRQSIKMTFLDIDARCLRGSASEYSCTKTSPSLVETIKIDASEYSDILYLPPEDVVETGAGTGGVEVSTAGGVTTITALQEANSDVANELGYGANPTDPAALTDEQKLLSVGFEFTNTAQFTLKVNLAGNSDTSNGRNIFFVANSSLTEQFCVGGR